MRYAIKGARPGTQFFLGGRCVATNPIDGGAVLTDAQREELTKRRYTLVKVDADAPAEIEPQAPSSEVKGEIARANERAHADALAPLKKRNQLKKQ